MRVAAARGAARIICATGGAWKKCRSTMRGVAAPLAKLLWIGCTKGSEGRLRF